MADGTPYVIRVGIIFPVFYGSRVPPITSVHYYTNTRDPAFPTLSIMLEMEALPGICKT